MNPEREMFIEKFQILVLTCVTTDHKLFWLKQWNQFGVLRGVQKFPKQGFLVAMFDKWFHRTFFSTMFDSQCSSSSCFRILF
jgi:hypothetical protein